jgi:hypothetical protein
MFLNEPVRSPTRELEVERVLEAATRRVTSCHVRSWVTWLCLAVIIPSTACDRAPDLTQSPLATTPTPDVVSGPGDKNVLAAAPGSFLQACRETAQQVGYPVPCPSVILAGGSPPPEVTSCQIELIGAAGLGGCAHSWRGWVVGSMQTDQHHLVLQASPEPVRSLARMINGPGWYPGASVVRLGKVRAGGWAMREVYADPATNEGSAFSGHLVLVWSAGRHTYALGFHLNGSRHETRMLNATVARSVSLVPP